MTFHSGLGLAISVPMPRYLPRSLRTGFSGSAARGPGPAFPFKCPFEKDRTPLFLSPFPFHLLQEKELNTRYTFHFTLKKVKYFYTDVPSVHLNDLEPYRYYFSTRKLNILQVIIIAGNKFSVTFGLEYSEGVRYHVPLMNAS